MNGRAERQAARAARAFPPRWRARHEDELLATIADMAPPGADHLPWSMVADVIRAGWQERWRTRPPLHRYAWYVLGGKLPRQWHPWLRDELNGKLFGLRSALRQWVLMNSVWLVLFLVLGQLGLRTPPTLWIWPIGSAVVLPIGAMMGAFRRTEALRRHHLIDDGEPDGLRPPVLWRPALTASHAAAKPAAFAAGLLLALVAVADVAAVTGPGSSSGAAPVLLSAAVGLAVGIALAMALGRLVRSRRPLLPERPALTPSQRRRWTQAAAAALAAAIGLGLLDWFDTGPGAGNLVGGTVFLALGLVAAALALATRVRPGQRVCTLADLVVARTQLVWMRHTESGTLAPPV